MPACPVGALGAYSSSEDETPFCNHERVHLMHMVRESAVRRGVAPLQEGQYHPQVVWSVRVRDRWWMRASALGAATYGKWTTDRSGGSLATVSARSGKISSSRKVIARGGPEQLAQL